MLYNLIICIIRVTKYGINGAIYGLVSVGKLYAQKNTKSGQPAIFDKLLLLLLLTCIKNWPTEGNRR